MNSITKIKEYIDSVVPQNISLKKRKKLCDELLCHILDKIDFYKEIGYSEEQSTEKAIFDMGTDESTKNFLRDEFEEIYHERTWWAFIPAILIVLMNFLCFPLGTWTASFDYGGDPVPWKVAVSLFMIFIPLAFIRFANVKRYRKMLIGVGMGNLIVSLSLGWWFYPQAAMYAIEKNFIFAVAECTPFILKPDELEVWVLFSIVLPAILFFYCIIQSLRIKKGIVGKSKSANKVTAILGGIYIIFSVFTVLLFPAGEDFCDNYPIWFDEYYYYISDESEMLFESIDEGDTYSDVRDGLIFLGYTTADEYEKTLHRVERKEFRKDIGRFDFEDGYEIWFKTEDRPGGNGFIGIKQKNGIITAKAVGNLEEKMHKDIGNFLYADYNFGYTDIDFEHDIPGAADYFRSLKKGIPEEEIMNYFNDESCFVYSKRFSSENNIQRHYYRIYLYGEVNMAEKNFFDRNEGRYIEFSFENGALQSGTLYAIIRSDKGEEILTESVR